VEYSAIAGSPLVIYGVRTALDAYYNYRLSNSQNHLNELYKQREATIEKLKTATKYNSTQQLLDKYGGTPKKRQPSPQPPKKRKSEGGQSNQSTPQGGRTGFMPPPTANIPGRSPPSGPLNPDGSPVAGLTPPQPPPIPRPIEAGEEFAPNAFSAPSRPLSGRQLSSSSQYANDGPKWYDRILDVVLGEDETQARNRVALICQNCRLVNGQAPPGVRTLEEIGRWRCSACHTMNGVESEERKMLKQISGEPISPTSPCVPASAVTDPGPGRSQLDGHDDDSYEEIDGAAGEDSDGPMPIVDDDTPARSTRRSARQRKQP
jgi:endoplasmic reticulum junction formation protein lunapark